MFVNEDILVGERDVIAHVGTYADEGHTVDPGAVEKLTDGFRTTENIFEIFIAHRSGRNISVDGCPDHISLRVEMCRFFVRDGKLLCRNRFSGFFPCYQFLVFFGCLIRITVDEQPFHFQLLFDFPSLILRNRVIPIEQIFLLLRPEGLPIEVPSAGDAFIFRDVLDSRLIFLQPLHLGANFRRIVIKMGISRLFQIKPVIFECSGNVPFS